MSIIVLANIQKTVVLLLTCTNNYRVICKNRQFKVFQEQVETVYLSETELASLYALDLPANKAQIRDNFLISCYTSLRYSDISRLERRHINYDNNTIVITTQKTGVVVVIPIHPIVRDILSRYDNQPPKAQCNQATNRVIKELCRSAGITNPVNILETPAVARKSK